MKDKGRSSSYLLRILLDPPLDMPFLPIQCFYVHTDTKGNVGMRVLKAATMYHQTGG